MRKTNLEIIKKSSHLIIALREEYESQLNCFVNQPIMNLINFKMTRIVAHLVTELWKS